MLAANRTDKVIGRITLLMSSMITMKGISAVGVPEGTRWAKNSVKLLNRLYIIKANQKGKARAKVIAKCLVAVKVNDKSPAALLNKSNRKIEMKIKILNLLVFSRVLNSLFMLLMILFNKILYGEVNVQ